MTRWRYRILGLIGLLILIGVAFGCMALAPREVDASFLRGPFQVMEFQRGKPECDRLIVTGSAEDKAIVDWLEAYRKCWSPSYVTYAPSRVIRGDGFNLNLLRNGLCVLNYDQSGNPHQVVRSVSKHDIDDLLVAIGIETN